ncbi:unnamed protein product [Litomosoides sigmodontis]|uniref:Uncharacterized protein n=1 Tax=Litomosoides sigmodontis TaxID=42156 RepID=A0A3P6T4L1_LITSI|nr:unnamed protein product [Litomosoides sigmodontis]
MSPSKGERSTAEQELAFDEAVWANEKGKESFLTYYSFEGGCLQEFDLLLLRRLSLEKFFLVVLKVKKG